MEYGLRLATLEGAFKSSDEWCSAALWNLCPDAPLTALYFGSEFCQDLLPGVFWICFVPHTRPCPCAWGG
jgi:hypothetical protein